MLLGVVCQASRHLMRDHRNLHGPGPRCTDKDRSVFGSHNGNHNMPGFLRHLIFRKIKPIRNCTYFGSRYSHKIKKR